MLIIGLGCRDRGDDAAGILVARRLAERGIEALEHTEDTFQLIELWKMNPNVVIADAVFRVASWDTARSYFWDQSR